MTSPQSSKARVIVGIDTGGTFTDITLLDPATGRVWSAKTPSTPDDPSRGFGNGIAEVLQAAGLTGADVARVLHGTTIATNLILEGKGAPAALITTAGFKYVIEIGRQDVPRRASLFAWVKPKRPVPPEHIFEVAGRIGPDGRELQPLDEAAVRAAAKAIRSRASARSPSCCCTATPTPRTSAASPPSSPRRCRTRWSRSPARCCPCSASTSAA